MKFNNYVYIFGGLCLLISPVYTIIDIFRNHNLLVEIIASLFFICFLAIILNFIDINEKQRDDI